MVNVVLALTQRKRMLLKTVILGRVWAKDFDFHSWHSLSLVIFFLHQVIARRIHQKMHVSCKLLPTTTDGQYRLLRSIQMISSLWGEFSPVGSALASFVSGSLDHFHLLNLAEKLRVCATNFQNRYLRTVDST